MKLTKRQKHIASCAIPTYGGYASKAEIKFVKILARGHYWDEPDFDNFVAYSPGGRRRFFVYNLCDPSPQSVKSYWVQMARKAASAWAKGNLRLSNAIHNKYWNQYQTCTWPDKSPRKMGWV